MSIAHGQASVMTRSEQSARHQKRIRAKANKDTQGVGGIPTTKSQPNKKTTNSTLRQTTSQCRRTTTASFLWSQSEQQKRLTCNACQTVTQSQDSSMRAIAWCSSLQASSGDGTGPAAWRGFSSLAAALLALDCDETRRRNGVGMAAMVAVASTEAFGVQGSGETMALSLALCRLPLTHSPV